ncbi:hypothetical protein JF66_20365 [Cryobacterium sp. MLB-32]|uniref:hypothetical protein n=1 Tax=Cryobacterium sp. MLB-32 TaxID=1529318 RepID=UPI0004E66160|nr:hypothetical protein [Cryobacterium sp. MLB-32]KFF58197.1 hypothetical protein JF66_20365 [Cryobacterium sp. MLB-32]
MADVRKSAKLTTARTLAREKSAQFREREDRLESLAVDYFTNVDQVDDINAAAEKEIARIRAQADRSTAERRASAAAVIEKMLDAGASRAEVAGRLGIATRDVKRASPIPPTPVKPAPENLAPVADQTEQESFSAGQ